MRRDWKEIKLGEIATFRNGLNYDKDSNGEGYKIVGVSNFGDKLKPEYSTLSEINPVNTLKIDDYLQVGDIVFVRSNGNKELVGRSMFIDREIDNLVFSGFCIRARFTSEEVFPLFCAYFFRTELFRKIISASSGGSNIQNLNQGLLSNSNILLPPLATQQKIASILSAYDDLIENNLRRIKLLEEMAAITYKEWFVNFTIDGQKLEIDAETGLPFGWERKTLVDIAYLTMGQSPESKYYNEDGIGIPFHQGVTGYTFRFPINKIWSTEGSRFAERGDILFSVRAPVGRLNVASEKIILGRGLASIRHKKQWNSFLYYHLKHTFFKDDMMGGGSIFNSVTKKDVEGILVTEAGSDVMVKFNQLIQPIDFKIENLSTQNRLLKEARDILLPRLMSGEIPV